MSDPQWLRLVFGVVLGTAIVAFALAAVTAASRPGISLRALGRFAERSRLPVPTASAAALEAYMRRSKIVEYVVLSVASAACLLLLLTPLGETPLYPLAVFVPVLLFATMLSATAVAVREHLFRPPLGAPRIARSRATSARDYLGTVRWVLPWTLTVGAVAAGAWAAWMLARDAAVRPEFAVTALVIAAVAILAAASLPRLDAAILGRPQPAGSELELAWDDALRLSALNACRQSVTVLSLAAVALAVVAAATSGAEDVPGWGFTLFLWTQLPLAFVYPTAGSPLRRQLHPQGIHVPLGSAA